MKKHRYSPEQIQFLKDNVAGRSYAELTDMFNWKFNCSVKKGTIKNNMYLRNIKRGGNYYYTPEEIQFLKDNVAWRSYRDLVERFNKQFGSHGKKLTLSKMAGISRWYKIKNNKDHTLSVIKTKRCPVGSEYITYDGITKIKLSDPDVWKKKHLFIWEAANGPVPKGHTVIFADENKSNFNLNNLLLVSFREFLIMVRQHLIFPDAEKTKNGLLIARLKILANDKIKEAKK
jgi:hypothetical protein